MKQYVSYNIPFYVHTHKQIHTTISTFRMMGGLMARTVMTPIEEPGYRIPTEPAPPDVKLDSIYGAKRKTSRQRKLEIAGLTKLWSIKTLNKMLGRLRIVD